MSANKPATRRRTGLAALIGGVAATAVIATGLLLGGGDDLPPFGTEHKGGYDRLEWGKEWRAETNRLLGWGLTGCKWAFYSATQPAECRAGGNSRDHLVPVEEAHSSGGWRWTAEQREGFYYDTGNLWIMPNHENREKSDKDPAGWLPEPGPVRCEYLHHWVATKDKYGLTADRAERAAIRAGLAQC